MNGNECKHFDRFVIRNGQKRRAGRGEKKNERNTAKQVWSSMSIAWWENDRPSRFSGHPIRSALVHCQFKYNISMFWFLLHRVSQLIQVLFLRLPLVQSRSVSFGCLHRLFGHREKTVASTENEFSTLLWQKPQKQMRTRRNDKSWELCDERLVRIE